MGFPNANFEADNGPSYNRKPVSEQMRGPVWHATCHNFPLDRSEKPRLAFLFVKILGYPKSITAIFRLKLDGWVLCSGPLPLGKTHFIDG